MKNFLLYFGIGFSSLILFAGIMITFVQNSGSESKATDIALIVVFALLDCFCIWKLTKNKKNAKKVSQQHNNTQNQYNNSQQKYTAQTAFQNKQHSQSEQDPIHIIADDSQVYISTGKTVVKADGTEIADNETPYIMRLTYQEKTKQEHQSSNPKFHRTPKEEELEFEFSKRYSLQIQKIVDTFEKPFHQSKRADDVYAELQLLREALANFEKAKEWFFLQGVAGQMFFEDNYLYLHNSQNDCFSMGDLIQNRIDYLIERMELKKEIIQRIDDLPGILQKDLYPLLSCDDKKMVQSIIRELEYNNQIIKTKHGNSYSLKIK